jgi:hypothetical protein
MHNLAQTDQRCDGEIWSDSEPEYCQRRDTCQRYLAYREEPHARIVAWMIPVRNCIKYIEAKPML